MSRHKTHQGKWQMSCGSVNVNATVYMEFQVCFTFAKYEAIRCLYVRQPMRLVVHICYSEIHFYQLGTFKLIKTMLKSLNVL